MRQFLALLIVVLMLPSWLFAQEGGGVCDNADFNKFCLSICAPQLENKKSSIKSVEVRKAKPKDDLYQNLVRIWFIDQTYINLLNKVFPSEQSAISALSEHYECQYGTFVFDWDAIDSNSISFNLLDAKLQSFTRQEETNVAFRVQTKSITSERNESLYTPKSLSLAKKVTIARGDGHSTLFYLPKPINNTETVVVYIGCRKLKMTDFTINPFLRTIVFSKPPKRKKKISVRYSTDVREFHFAFNFDNLLFEEDQQRLLGKDGDREEQNASFLSSREYVNFTSTVGKAWCILTDNPIHPGDRVLRFLAEKTNDRSSGIDKVRISGNVRTIPAVSFENSVDVFLPSDWEVLRDYPEAINWMTQQEYWCSTSGVPRDGYPQFRMTVGMLKERGVNKELFYYLKCQDLFTTVGLDGSLNERYVTLYEKDHRIDHVFPIPIGEWFNVKTIVESGDLHSGHFTMIVTTEDGVEHIVFDEICPTHATGYDVPNANEALYTSLSPLKLYTSGEILHFFKMSGKSLSIYYNNWNFTGTCINHQ